MSIDEALEGLARREAKTQFRELLRLCEHFFGRARRRGSHHIFKMPWAGDPRINLQEDKGQAKPYQIRQVVQALKKLQEQGE